MIRPPIAGALGLVLALCLSMATGSMPRAAEAQALVDQARAAQVKAAYLRYIAELTTWPDQAFEGSDEALVIGLVGEDDYGVGRLIADGIARVGLSAQQRPLELLRLPDPSRAPNDDSPPTSLLRRCHVLFVSKSTDDQWDLWRSAVAGLPIMTVSEVSGFSRSEGMIEFVISKESGRVMMHIDLAAVARARLRISARLLALGDVVHIVRGQQDARSGGSSQGESR